MAANPMLRYGSGGSVQNPMSAAIPPERLAFYVSPGQARTLTDAGLIEAGGWGSPEALERAQLSSDMSDAERTRTWQDHGWAVHQGQPRTWIDAPLSLGPWAAENFGKGPIQGPANGMLEGRGVAVLDALGLGDLPTEFAPGPEGMGGVRQFSETGKPSRLFGFAPNAKILPDLLHHEGQHAIDMMEAPIDDPYANPLSGTRAERILRAAGGRKAPDGTPASALAENAPEMASYLRSDHEDRARDNTIRQRDPAKYRMVPPGQIDTYSEDAWPGRRFDGAFGLKLRDYAPPKGTR